MKDVRLTVSVWVRVGDDVAIEDLCVAGKVFVTDQSSDAIEATMYETDDAQEVDDDDEVVAKSAE